MGCRVECIPLGELVTFESGGTPSKKNESFWNGDIPWISAKTLVGDRVCSSELHITKAGLESGSKIAPKGSLLLLTRGSGLFNRIPLAIAEEKVAFNQDVKCLNSNREGISNSYLFYALKSLEPAIASMLETTGIGAGKLSTDRLKQLPVPILDKNQRNKVEYFFGTLSRQISLNHRINDYLEETGMTLFNQLRDESENGAWHVASLKDCTSLISRGVTPKYDTNSIQIVLNQKCIRNHRISLEPSRRHVPRHINDKWLKKWDILICSTGQGTLGRVAQVYSNLSNTTVDSHVTIVRPKTEGIAAYLGCWALNSETLFTTMAKGSTGQTELSREDLGDLKISIPGERTLRFFLKQMEPLTQQIELNLAEIDLLSKIRDTLLPKLMSGEIDVSQVDITQLNNHLCDC